MYEYNELLKENLQKTSSGGGSQMTVDAALSETSTNPVQNKVITEALKPLNTPKVTKFFSAEATLEDNEIAQYQGEDDAANDLQNGFFYKKNPDITINKTSTKESLVMRNLFGYDFQNNLIVSQNFTADRTLSENIFISGNFDNSNDYTVVLFLIVSETTNHIFDSKWSRLTYSRILAPFVFFAENNSVVARYANVVYDGINFTIDGQRFYNKSQGMGNVSLISYNPDNNCFYYWFYYALGSIPFYFPVALASSDYSTADFIFTNSLPLIVNRLKVESPAALITYYTYTASINTVLFQRIDTQPRSAIMIVSANYITNNLSDILTQYTNIVQDTVFVLSDIDSTKTYYYNYNSELKNFKGNENFDLLFRYCGNNEFKPISFSPIY